MHQFEKIRFDLQGHVALIDLNSPQTMNRLYGPFFRDLNRAADEIEKNDGIFVAVITGGEKVFCTGDDVTQPEELQAQKELGLFDWMSVPMAGSRKSSSGLHDTHLSNQKACDRSSGWLCFGRGLGNGFGLRFYRCLREC